MKTMREALNIKEFLRGEPRPGNVMHSSEYLRYGSYPEEFYKNTCPDAEAFKQPTEDGIRHPIIEELGFFFSRAGVKFFSHNNIIYKIIPQPAPGEVPRHLAQRLDWDIRDIKPSDLGFGFSVKRWWKTYVPSIRLRVILDRIIIPRKPFFMISPGRIILVTSIITSVFTVVLDRVVGIFL